MTLYHLVQPSGVRSRLDVAAGRLTRFVGRDIELATLVDRWERVQDGEGQNVVVLGEAGVGTSRLGYQLHEHLADVPHTWLECGATPYTEGTPFHIPRSDLLLRSQASDQAPDGTGLGRLARAAAFWYLRSHEGRARPSRSGCDHNASALCRGRTADLGPARRTATG